MIKKYLLLLLLFSHIGGFVVKGQLPTGGQWGCPAIPIQSSFDTTCFIKTSQIKLGQGYFDYFGVSDPVYLVIPQNKVHYAISMAIGWNYFRNVVGNNSMNINQWFATMAQENGFSTYKESAAMEQLPATIYDAGLGAMVALPCQFPRGCNNYNGGGGSYINAANLNIPDGPYQFSLAGYQTVAPYVPYRFPGPAATYQPLYNANLPSATMTKTFYDLAIYRKAQSVNGVDIGLTEAASPDIYGTEGALAYAYNQGPNAPNAISTNGYVLPGGITTNTFWAGTYFTGGVSCYAQRVSTITAVLDSNKAYAVANYPAACGGTVANWHFYSFYDHLIPWDTVQFTLKLLLNTMYPTVNQTTYLSAVQTVFNNVKGGAALSFRYEFGPVLDAIIQNLPKDDPGATAANAINGTGCNLGCTAPYTKIQATGPTTVCTGQTVVLNANVDGATSTTTYQWLKNGAVIPGATSQSYNATTSGTYGIVVCWGSINIKTGAAVTCCAQPECTVNVTVLASCSSCSMALGLVQTQNACTTMPNGAITATIVTAALGPYLYSWSGPSSGSFTSASLSYTIPNLRDGHYTVVVSEVSTPGCRAVQDIFVTSVTVIKQTITATEVPASCATQLNAVIVNQQPNTCPIQVSYGAIGGYSWDASFYMDLRDNQSTILNMFEGYNLPYSATSPTLPWDAWPYNYPLGGAGNAPVVTTVTVADGDTLTAEGIVIIPLGIAAPTYDNGAIRLDNASFKDVVTSVTASTVTFKYQGAAPAPGLRQMGNKVVVTCPVVSPPAFTYAWSPASGLTNASIANPTASVSSATTYTVTATYPTNPACKLTASVLVPINCTSLPVDFVEFTAVNIADHGYLQWNTINELNCSQYVVEKSTDGINFKPIGILNCQNSTSLTAYAYTDPEILNNTVYYKIKQLDFNGNAKSTEVESIASSSSSTVTIEPNPFVESINISLKSDVLSDVTLQLLDINGRMVYSQPAKSISDVSIGLNLSSGLYILQVIYPTRVNQYKLVKE
jgi:hypothetical protein